MRHLQNKVVTLWRYITNNKTLRAMRNYTYHSRIVTELYRDDALSRCEIITLHYDGSRTHRKMWMTTRMFEEAFDGCQDIMAVIDRAYEDLVKNGRI